MRKGLFFIWPASVKWGKNQTYNGVRLGFQLGYLLADPDNYLENGERKQVYWRTFENVKDIDKELLRALIFESAILDQENKV